MHILSEPLSNYVILFSFLKKKIRIMIFNLYKKNVILNLSRIMQL